MSWLRSGKLAAATRARMARIDVTSCPRAAARITRTRASRQSACLRRRDHRPHGPQGVVQIEADDACRGHARILPWVRLQLGIAASPGGELRMRAHRLTATLALLAAAAAHLAKSRQRARRRARSRARRSACRIWCGSQRISEAAVSPDGKRVAYTLRTTDMEANKGRTAIWVIETSKRGAAPVSDHRRRGEFEFAGMDRRRPLHLLPLESRRHRSPGLAHRAGRRSASAGHLSAARRRLVPCQPQGRSRLVVSSRCSPIARLSSAPSSGSTPWRTIAGTACCTTRFSSGTGTPGATGAARSCSRFRSTPSGLAGATPVNLTRRHRRRRAGQAVRRTRGLCDQPGRTARGVFGARGAGGRALVHQFRHLRRSRRGRHAAQSDRRQSRLGRAAGLFARRLAGSRTSRWTAPDSRRTACIWCSSI